MVSHMDDEAACQLQFELQASLRRAHHSKRPILTHLNADTSWLISLPYPEHASPPAGRSRYNILLDPWLKGSQEDVAGWFSKQWHSIESSVQTIAELENALRDAERLDRDENDVVFDFDTDLPAARGRSCIDAVAVSHEFTDHCHQATLLELDGRVPVFATKKAAQLIQSWKHFDRVIEIGTFSTGTDWRATSLAPLPGWIGIGRLVTGFDMLYFHSALVICVQMSASSDHAEAVIYTPHGVQASTVSVLTETTPRLEALALLHGLHDVSIGWTSQLNLGVVNAVKAQKILRAKYWVGTHDEEKPSSGVIAPLLRTKNLSVSEALASLSGKQTSTTQWTTGSSEDLGCIELRNGESLLLE
ncbi:hypothetical protein LTR99_007424 [Exophiala xenobiotica]|uniref:Uncharacterized protein n=1 Tax=Vermiconidia calcicola TaxID=1690605 RepID=A0AAV9Q5S2_9PEZI|nr:hypothetical protein H2202_006823 [Exophiala xenobiotica]KAK5534533.1 hypothetical protein LTR25_006565 [Vermiconidia calcicola]KAK5544585.1 hypothetical protein LTR23_004349 [Chaetothyriales sp. CCFEE 6169]KAK5207468.1 hypothetical protein LTR41_007037 [Exophiala xenobiotica]KAK5228121.1 hypothetical protein LTR72_002004 [Exophiala xenobiotica]